jgi:Adenylate and Guanylate cyclase catalytic domain
VRPSRSRDTPAGARFASPQSYTPKHLAEKILTSKTALEGERKQVTVLFADLKGSMELLADRDPEEARKILDPVLERMMEAVHRYEGTVNQVMGDGIMALFGAPVAHEDHAVRACYAALRMQATVKKNSGEVVVRSMDYTAVALLCAASYRLDCGTGRPPHPGWTLGERWPREVLSYALDDGSRLLLFDPLSVPDELLELAADREPAAPWHERDTQSVLQPTSARKMKGPAAGRGLSIGACRRPVFTARQGCVRSACVRHSFGQEEGSR